MQEVWRVTGLVALTQECGAELFRKPGVDGPRGKSGSETRSQIIVAAMTRAFRRPAWQLALLLFVAAAPASGASDGKVAIKRERDRWKVSCPLSPVTLKIPAGSFKVNDLSALNGPRYFNFTSDSGVTLSGWYESVDHYKGLVPFWKSESARFYANPATAPADVIFGKIGRWEIILYDQPAMLMDQKVTVVHAHAELCRAGTWIDLHLSKGTIAANAASVRTQLTDLIEQVEVVIAPEALVSPQATAAAAADLTDHIENLDNAGYAKAVATFTRYLVDQPTASYPISSDARPWAKEAILPTIQQMLDLAFLASLVQDDFAHRTDDRLYRAWRVVLKYYSHYTDRTQSKGGDGVWPRIPALDRLLEMEQAGQLKHYAESVPLMKP